jgi:transmembrane sensor
MTAGSNADRLSEAATEEAQDWFLRLAGGAPEESDLAAFRAWHDADADHRAAFAEIRELWNDLGDLQPALAAPPAMPAAVDLEAARRRPRLLRPRAVFGGLLAACLALVAVFVADLPTRFSADFRTAVGERARIALPDGSTAHLNTDSAIALDYSDERRRVTLLRGEAVFEVSKDPARPFDVEALGGRATALGTAFALRRQDDDAVVTVIEGRVGVASPAGEAGAAPDVRLRRDQQVSYRRGAAPGPVVTVDAAAVAAWRRGLIVIDALPLSDALAELDRYHPGRILLLGGTGREERVTARIAFDDIDGGLRALAAIHGLQVTHVTDYLVIVR